MDETPQMRRRTRHYLAMLDNVCYVNLRRERPDGAVSQGPLSPRPGFAGDQLMVMCLGVPRRSSASATATAPLLRPRASANFSAPCLSAGSPSACAITLRSFRGEAFLYARTPAPAATTRA